MLRLFDVPHCDMRFDAPIWLTVNPVEYHGPHLSMHNDLFLSHGVAADVCRANGWQFVVADDLEVGVGPTPGPGSRFTSFQTVRALVVEACERLADVGAKQVVLMTFHGDPLHNLALSAGVEVLEKRGVKAVAPFNRLMDEMLTLHADDFAPALQHVQEPQRGHMLRQLKFDFHAGFFETSLSLHYAPQTVSQVYKTLPPCPPIQPAMVPLAASLVSRALGKAHLAEELRFAAQGFAWHALEPFPGYTSSPHLATAEAGAIFAREICRRFSEDTAAVFAGERGSPKPIMRWAEALSYLQTA